MTYSLTPVTRREAQDSHTWLCLTSPAACSPANAVTSALTHISLTVSRYSCCPLVEQTKMKNINVTVHMSFMIANDWYCYINKNQYLQVWMFPIIIQNTNMTKQDLRQV